MHIYEFIFRCEECGKELREFITSPDILTIEDLTELGFCLTCTNLDCRWKGARTGQDAEHIIMPKISPVCS
jgi:hypothetical protein